MMVMMNIRHLEFTGWLLASCSFSEVMKNADAVYIFGNWHREMKMFYLTLMHLKMNCVNARVQMVNFLWMFSLPNQSRSCCLFRGLFCVMLFKKGLKSINRTLGVNGFELSLPLAIVAPFQVNTTFSLSHALFYCFQKFHSPI